jgi:hypothetical protein
MHAGRRKQAERWVRKLRTWTGSNYPPPTF